MASPRSDTITKLHFAKLHECNTIYAWHGVLLPKSRQLLTIANSLANAHDAILHVDVALLQNSLR